VAEVLIVGYEHVVMNCGSAGNSVSSILVGILPLSHSSPSYLGTAISNYGVSLGRSLRNSSRLRMVDILVDRISFLGRKTFLSLKSGLRTDICTFFCQNLQFCWSQTSHTNSPDQILKPILGDTEYGCAWYWSAIRGCLRLLWLTESHSTMVFCCS
nr:hypothetical protein [Tanacetum cinerariifolium]